MSDNDNEELDSTTQSSEEDVKTDDVEDESANDDSEDIEKLRESNKRLFERTKKAEAEAKLLKAERVKKEETAKAEEHKPVEKQTDFDLEDVAVFVQKVSNKEDRELVKDYAKFKGITLEEALEHPVIAATLKDNEEKRKSAAATNTGTGRRGVSKPSPEQILEDAAAGKTVDPDDLAQARLDSKRK